MLIFGETLRIILWPQQALEDSINNTLWGGRGASLFLVILLTPTATLFDPLTAPHSPRHRQVCYDKIAQLWTAFGKLLISGRCADVSPVGLPSSSRSEPCTVPALVPDGDQHPPLWEMDAASVHTCSINIYGESKRRPLAENCPALELRGRVSWFIIRAEVISDLILCIVGFFFSPRVFSRHVINF